MDKFFKLHHSKKPLLLANVWDVASARIAEQQNFDVIGTSSAAIASILGYDDGEQMSFSELIYMVKRIRSCTSIPLTVDIEAGYGATSEIIVSNIMKLNELGVVGVNIEDSEVQGTRVMTEAQKFASRINHVRKSLIEQGVSVFLNIRTDGFLMGLIDAKEETEKRIALYEQAGADGIFIPCIEKEEDISQMVKCTQLPVNVMCMPNLPDFDTLERIGVKRISMGNFAFEWLMKRQHQLLETVCKDKNFKAVFS